MNKYLNGDPIPWLTDGENPAVTFLAKREFSETQDDSSLYSELENSSLAAYFRKVSTGDIPGDQKNFDLFYKGAVWFFLLAVESGFDIRTGFIVKTADFLCTRTQHDDGGFSFRSRPPVSVGCRTGDMVAALLKAGISDERTSAGLRWIIRNQRLDGGWLHCPFRGFADTVKLVLFNRSGNGERDDSLREIPSCPVATFSCLKALSEAEPGVYDDPLRKGIEFLFSLDLLNPKTELLTRCGLSIDLLKPGYPVMSQSDIISLLVIIMKTGLWRSSSTGGLFNYVMRLQGSSGRWNSINNNQGFIREKSGESRWVTHNTMRMIRAITEKENQLEKA